MPQSVLPDGPVSAATIDASVRPIDEAVMAVLRWREHRVGEADLLAGALGVSRFAGWKPLPTDDALDAATALLTVDR